MKGVSAIIDRIQKDAEKESRRILRDAETERDKILGEAQEEASRIIKEAQELAKVKAKEREEQLLAHARLEAKHKELEAKNRALEEVYSKAEDELKKFVKSAKYRKFLESKLKSLGKPVKVHVVKRDAKLIKGYKVVGDLADDLLGGFVADFGDYEIDMTLRSMLDSAFEESRGEIYKRLIK